MTRQRKQISVFPDDHCSGIGVDSLSTGKSYYWIESRKWAIMPYVLILAFTGGSPPPAPFPECRRGTTVDHKLSCESPPECAEGEE